MADYDYKTGEEIVLTRDAYGYKKGTKCLFLWKTTSSGFTVALVAVKDDHMDELFRNNGYYNISQMISDLERINNISSMEMRLNCIKPYYAEICSKNQILEEIENNMISIENLQNKNEELNKISAYF